MIPPRPARFACFLALSMATGLAGAGFLPAVRAEQPPAIDPARNPAGALAADLGPLWECLTGARETFAVEGTVAIGGSGKPMKVAIKLERFDSDTLKEIRDVINASGNGPYRTQNSSKVIFNSMMVARRS